MLVTTILILSAVSGSWSRSVPSSPPSYNPRELWDMLKTVAPEPDRPTAYPRIQPISEEYGASPSALYLMESFRLIGLNQLTADSISAFSAYMYEGLFTSFSQTTNEQTNS